MIDWWDYGHALFDAVEFEGNVSKAPLRLSSEEVSRNSSHRPAGSGCSAGFCSVHGSWPAPHTEAMAALFLDGWQNLSFGGFSSQAGTSFISVDEECTIGPLKKAALGSGPLRTCDGLSSTILPGLVRNVAHALSEGVKHTHHPNSKQKHGQAWETPTDSGKGRWMMTAVPESSHGQHSLSLGPVGLSRLHCPLTIGG